MKHYLLVGAVAVALAGCVQPPEAQNSAPILKLSSDVTKTYPGSRFRIWVAELSDKDSNDDISVSWNATIDGVSVVEQSNAYAEFEVDPTLPVNQIFDVIGTASDGNGGVSSSSTSVQVVSEPFVIIDAKTDSRNKADMNPLYLAGVYSAKSRNLKSNDVMSSTNYSVDISPDGRYVFYIQLMENAEWVAHLYDSYTAFNYLVDIDFSNVLVDEIDTYWSNDNQYLAIKLPGTPGISQTALCWLSTADLSDQSVISINRRDVYFTDMIWSNNDNSKMENAYATLKYSEGRSFVVFDPMKDESINIYNSVEGDAFTNVDVNSFRWVNNQLFFMASTLPKTTENVFQYDLYKWVSTSEPLKKINTIASNVEEYSAYNATKVVFSTVSSELLSMYYFNGINDRELVADIPYPAREADYRWSPYGHLLGFKNATTEFSTWRDGKNIAMHIDPTDGVSVDSWAWGEDYNSVFILNRVSDIMNTIYLVETSEPDTYKLAVENISIMSTTNTNVPDSLFNTLQRSPDGTWQLFWALKTDASDEHIDLWAYNTVTQETANLSRLKEMYEAPVSEGIFTTKAGFNDSDDLKWVNTDIVWLNNSELLFKVMSIDDAAVTTPEIVDVRMVSLDTLAMPRSIILNPETKTELTRVVSQ